LLNGTSRWPGLQADQTVREKKEKREKNRTNIYNLKKAKKKRTEKTAPFGVNLMRSQV